MQARAELRTALDTLPYSSRRHSEPASVAAVVVLYHPQTVVLARLLDSVASQVEKVFVVDNTPGRSKEMPVSLARAGCAFAYRANGVNQGLARAQNIGIAKALEEDYTHVLLLDQDSALPDGAVDGLLTAEASLLRAGQSVAAVGPIFIDEKTGVRSRGVRGRRLRLRWFSIPAEERNPVEADYLIASGSLIRSSVLRQVGLMRDELFIDWVDTEWSYRANHAGHKTYIVPTVVMRHSIGDSTATLMGRHLNLHSPARNYYIVRNAMYLLRDRRMGLSWRMTMVFYIPKYILVHGWLSQSPVRSMLQMLRAMWEGLAGTMRPFTSQ